MAAIMVGNEFLNLEKLVGATYYPESSDLILVFDAPGFAEDPPPPTTSGPYVVTLSEKAAKAVWRHLQQQAVHIEV